MVQNTRTAGFLGNRCFPVVVQPSGGGGRFQNGGPLTGIFLLLLFVLTSKGILQFPRGLNIPFFDVWPRLPDLAKAVGFFVLIFLWTPITKQLVPETPVGAVLVLGPDAVFLLTALVYLSNSFSGNLK